MLDLDTQVLYICIYKYDWKKMEEKKDILHHCLYFTANSLSRVITRMAGEEFSATGLSPSHAFLMMLVNDKPGIGQKELCEHLHLAPSTITRFIDTLVHKGYLYRKNDGKSSRIYPTRKGVELQKPIETAWMNLHVRYCGILGAEEGDELTRIIDEAGKKLESFQ